MFASAQNLADDVLNVINKVDAALGAVQEEIEKYYLFNMCFDALQSWPPRRSGGEQLDLLCLYALPAAQSRTLSLRSTAC